MTKQVIFYTQGLRYEVAPTEGRQLLLGASEKAQVYLPQQEEEIRLKADGDEVFYQFGEETGLLTDGLYWIKSVFALEIKLRQFMIFWINKNYGLVLRVALAFKFLMI